MTPSEINTAIAKVCGLDNRWVLMKRGLYWRPNDKGYTACISEAGIYTEEEADKRVYPHDEPVTKHPAPIPDYCGSLDAMHEAEKMLNLEQENNYIEFIRDVVGCIYGEFFRVHATASQRAEALLRTLNLWTS